jgi:hyaluronan synthase
MAIKTSTKINVFMFLMSLVLLAPAFIGYIMKLKIKLYIDFALSVYGINSIVFLIIQIICAIKNSKKINEMRESRPVNWDILGVGLVIVGYREEKILLKKCLESIKNSKYTNIKRIIFIIDGNDIDDLYMADIYKEVFPENQVINVDFLVGENVKENKYIDYEIFGKDDICILQPHGGKREGLYTGFKLFLNDPSIDVIITTDSDTIVDEMAITELTYASNKANVGAVAGQILVWNSSDSILTHIISYRYWFSFNLERACESYWETVLCIAGPMGCYKAHTLSIILDEWYNQTFLGQNCTFGDDRHLTNRILKTGQKVIYTEHAIGYTDTPIKYGQYYKQQTRWSKSYFREFLFNLQALFLHSFWMTYELTYQIVYYFLLMYWSVYILYFGSVQQQSIAIIITLIMSIIKSLYGVIKEKNINYIFFYLYSYIYTLIIVPSKLHALITLWDMEWGTRGKAKSLLSAYWSIIVWYSTLIGGFAYSIYKNYEFKITYSYYKIAFICLMIYVGIILITFLLEYILRKNKYFSNDIEQNINNENFQLKNITIDNYELCLTPKLNETEMAIKTALI